MYVVEDLNRKTMRISGSARASKGKLLKQPKSEVALAAEQSLEPLSAAMIRLAHDGDTDSASRVWAHLAEHLLASGSGVQQLEAIDWISKLTANSRIENPVIRGEVRLRMLELLMVADPSSERTEKVAHEIGASLTDGEVVEPQISATISILFQYYALIKGKVAKALMYLNWPTMNQSEGDQIRRCWSATIAWFEGRNQDAVRESLRDSARSNAWELLCGFFAATAIDDHNAVQAIFAVAQERIPGARSTDRCIFLVICSRYFVHSGQLALAAEFALNAGASKPHCASSFALSSLALALIRSEQGQFEEADKVLESVERTAADLDNSMIVYWTILHRAINACEAGLRATALEHFQRAAVAGRSGDFAMAAWHGKASLLRLCQLAADEEVEMAFARTLHWHVESSSTKRSRHRKSLSWRTRIYTLGHFRLTRGEDHLSQDVHLAGKPAELLRAVVSVGRREGVDAEHVASLLWPDADGDLARKSLDTTLHRLRRAIGEDHFMVLKGGNLQLDESQCWIDFWTLETLLDKLESPRLSAQQHFELVVSAARLYKGDFLLGEVAGWAEFARGRTKRRLVAELHRAAQTALERKDCGRTMWAFEKLLEVDPTSESGYLGYMRAAKELGQLGQAILIHHRYEAALTTLLGVRRSEAADSIWQEAKASVLAARGELQMPECRS